VKGHNERRFGIAWSAPAPRLRDYVRALRAIWRCWESGEKLFAYAHDRQGEHFPAWSEFNRKARDNHAVGIWHETYMLKPEDCENIYRDMPPFGLGGAIGVKPATARMGGLRDPFERGVSGPD